MEILGLANYAKNMRTGFKPTRYLLVKFFVTVTKETDVVESSLDGAIMRGRTFHMCNIDLQ